MKKNAAIAFVLLIVGYLIWRNYGVVSKGDVLDITNPTTNEQKELARKVKESNQGSIIQTSFGIYQYKDKNWVKIKELWE